MKTPPKRHDGGAQALDGDSDWHARQYRATRVLAAGFRPVPTSPSRQWSRLLVETVESELAWQLPCHRAESFMNLSRLGTGMKNTGMNKQRGLTLTGLIITAAVVVFFAL